jgi:hypothetical protein
MSFIELVSIVKTIHVADLEPARFAVYDSKEKVHLILELVRPCALRTD